MNAETFGIVVLSIYAVIACGTILWRVLTYPSGWRICLLYFLERLYVGMGFHWRSSGRCPWPGEGPAILLANHRSPVDPLLIWMNSHFASEDRTARPPNFFTAKEYTTVGGFIGWICTQMQCIPVDRNGRDMASVRDAVKRLKAGRIVGVFPEGKINLGRDLLPGHSGVAWLALHSGAPVYPVFVHNAPQGNSMVQSFYTFQRVKVTYGNAIDLSAYVGKRKTPELLEEVTDLMMKSLAELGGVNYLGELPEEEEESESDTQKTA